MAEICEPVADAHGVGSAEPAKDDARPHGQAGGLEPGLGRPLWVGEKQEGR